MTYPTVNDKLYQGEKMIKVTSIRHSYPEKGVFTIDRKNGHENYTFLHFFNSMDIQINGKIIRTEPHACIIFNIGTPQFFKSNTDIVHDWIHFSGPLDNLLNQCSLETDKIYYPKSSSFITDITKEMEREYFFDSNNRDLMLNAKTEELFIKLSRACFNETSSNLSSDTKERFKNLREDMFANLNKLWTTEQMANSVGLSKSRFYNVYKNIYGNTPTDDLIKARIDYAKNALSFSQSTVSQIAESLGYLNTTHFIRQFKSVTGFSPGEYRKKHSK